MQKSMDELYKQVTNNQYPQSCYLAIDQESEINPKRYKSLLLEYGMVIIDVKVPDQDGTIMTNIIDSIGIGHVHDASGRIMWDIKRGGKDGDEALARSHKDSEFVFHTDCSYEQDNPGYFGLYVVEPDNKGGGKNLLVSNTSIIEKLSKRGLEILTENQFTFKVPAEFYKGTDAIRASVIDKNMNLRYRFELINKTGCNQEEIAALDELEQIIADPDNLTKLSLKKNQCLLMDNRRFLHARTQIKDGNRHLKRIRFNMNDERLRRLE